MDTWAVGFWGAFFGTAGLMLAASLAAFARSLHRVALMAALSAIISAAFVVAYLGWLPVADPDVQARLLAHVAVVAAVSLALMLLSMLGLLRRRDVGARAWRLLLGTGAAVIAVEWMLDPMQALVLGSGLAFAVGVLMLLLAVRRARRGDWLAWTAVSGVSFMLVAETGLSWIALEGEDVPWQVHAVTAVAGMAYLATMASALWARYSYLIELREVMAHGPAYDPVTRMRSHAQTGQMVGAAFFNRTHQRPLGVIVISIANLYALENLHGRAAFNHALFICAGRLRRSTPPGVETGRLGDDGFLMLVHDDAGMRRLATLARLVRERLARPVVLSTGRDAAALEGGRTEWMAEVGVGVLSASAQARPAQALTTARAMSRTAWTYNSRMAWFDPAAGQIMELPASEPA